ncbi:hypothetical protein CEXT_4551, partial [Caerostris extrusa]
CDCGIYGSCSFIGHQKVCSCSLSTSQKDGKCVECDCGFYGICTFEAGEKKCICSPQTIQIDGNYKSTTERPKTTMIMTTSRDCYCGKNSYSCSFDWRGGKICGCHFGYVQKDGYCTEICSDDKMRYTVNALFVDKIMNANVSKVTLALDVKARLKQNQIFQYGGTSCKFRVVLLYSSCFQQCFVSTVKRRSKNFQEKEPNIPSAESLARNSAIRTEDLTCLSNGSSKVQHRNGRESALFRTRSAKRERSWSDVPETYAPDYSWQQPSIYMVKFLHFKNSGV